MQLQSKLTFDSVFQEVQNLKGFNIYFFSFCKKKTALITSKKVLDVERPESMELLMDDIKKSLLQELGDARGKKLIPTITEGATRNYYNSHTADRVKWPACLRQYTNTKYHGACTRIVPEDEKVFQLDEERGDVPFKKKIFGIDGKVRFTSHGEIS